MEWVGAQRDRKVFGWWIGPVCLLCFSLCFSMMPALARASQAATYATLQRSAEENAQARVIPIARDYLRRFPNRSQRPQVLFWLAEALYATQAFEDAVATYRVLIREAPAFAQIITAHRHLALSYVQIRHYNMALQTFANSLEQFPGMPGREQIVLHMAVVHLEQGGFDEALPLYEQLLLMVEPPISVSKLHLQLGDCYLYMRQFSRAQQHYLTVLRQHEASSEAVHAYYQLGTVAMLQHQYDVARHYFQVILKTYPADARAIQAHYAMAATFYHQGQVERAVVYLQQWHLVAQPTATDALLAHVHDLLVLRAYTDVIDRLLGALKQIDNVEQAQQLRWLLTRASVKSGHPARGIEALDDFIRRFPASLHTVTAQRWRGDLLVRQRDVSQALVAYRAALSQAHDDEQAEQLLLAIADLHQTHDDVEDAMATWRRLLQAYPLSPRHTSVTLKLAAALVQQGAIAEAVTRYRKLLAAERPPTVRRQVRLQLAWAYVKGGEYDRAREIYSELAETGKDTETLTQVRYWLGWILQRQGQYEASNLQWQALLAMQLPAAQRGDVLWHLASNLIALDRHQEGCTRLQDVVMVDKMAPYARLASQQLQACLLEQRRYRQVLRQTPAFERHDPMAVFQVAKQFARGEQLFKAKRYRQARYVFEQIIALPVVTSLTDDAVFMLAESFFAEGDTRRAMQHYREMTRQYARTPLSALASYREGRILLQAGQLAAATQALQQAAQNASDADIRERSWYHLGKAYVQLQQREAAVAVLRRLLQQGSMAFATEAEHLQVGLMLQQMADYAMALQVFQRIAKQASDARIRAEVQFWIAETYQLQGDVGMALQAYQQMASQYPAAQKWALTALFRAGEIYERQQQYTKAIGLYQQVVATAASDHPRGRYAAERIKHLKAKMAAIAKQQG
ncbi:MAG: tetratricopeptide repeat protein [bacterium]|nr:tetratricopeptide repeat protein [bacterium]